MADPVAVGIDMGTLLFMFIAAGSTVGAIAYTKFDSYMHGKQIKNDIRTELLDKEQTKEIKRMEREIDKSQTK